MRTIYVLLAGLALAFPAVLGAVPTAAEAHAAWESAREWNVSQAPMAVPAGGLRIELDSASFQLTSGTLRPLAPVLGQDTGFIFEGRGTFVMEIPDATELAQLRRLLGQGLINRFETAVTRAVFRSARPIDGVPTADGATTGSSLARDRHLVWLTEDGVDVDARIIESILNDEKIPVVRLDVDTPDHGWLTYSIEPLRQEEVRLDRLTNRGNESWVSLDRAAERRQDGRPSANVRQVMDIESVDFDIDLRKGGRWGSVGYASVRSANAQIDGTLRVIPKESGLRALTFAISGTAELKSVLRGSETLSWMRDQIGERAAKIEDDVWTSWFTVLLDEPTVAETPIDLRMSWSMHLPAYAAGLIWYPTPAGEGFDPVTGKLRFRTINRQDVRSSGRRTESESGDERVIEYVIDRPMKMLGFVIGQRFIEAEIPAAAGVPPVIAWGPGQGLGARSEVRNVAVDVHNSVRFFSWLLDEPIDADRIVISGIPSGHGQSFDGFIQMAEYTFGHDSRGPTELFRAHEVAHQWFGHKVGWVSDRDQWLSESLAEYAAMMFVQSTVDGGDRLFQDILDTYTNILFGSLRGSAGRFARPWLIEINDKHRERVGPIGHGVRASTIEVPGGYQMQAYHKGPLVIHMLRLLLGYKYPNDEMFVRVLRAYIDAGAGGIATTASLRNILERETQANWGWFFDQWIDRAAIPDYRWNSESVQVDGQWKLRMNVTQSGVADSFMMPVPVRIELRGHDPMVAIMNVSGPESRVEWNVPGRPSKVTFNPDHAVLASVGRD